MFIVNLLVVIVGYSVNIESVNHAEFLLHMRQRVSVVSGGVSTSNNLPQMASAFISVT